ncbi:hypothetical protein M9435_004512 [Picochlorum sp. BPE23]|nr:hypothetical protein M9435_004512 [Picochlorum sp. BPE23]
MKDSVHVRLGIIHGHLGEGNLSGGVGSPVQKRHVCLIGSCIRDIQAWVSPGEKMAPGGSSMGRVTYSAGGVAFNIARALRSLLEYVFTECMCEVELISAVGDDEAGKDLIKMCQANNISTRGVSRIPNGPRTASVVIVFDGSGDVAYSVADVDIVERFLTPDLVSRSIHPSLGLGGILVLDGDLDQASILRACKDASRSRYRVVFEPTSRSKAPRCIPALKHIDYITPNVDELTSIVHKLCQHHPDNFPKSCQRGRASIEKQPRGINIPSVFLNLAQPAAAVVQAGVGHVLVTAGDQGAALFFIAPENNDSLKCIYCPALPTQVVSVSGAGDCLAAGFILGLTMDATPRVALAMGVANAWEALQSESNVSDSMEEKRFKANVDHVLTQIQEAHVSIQCCCITCCMGE